MILTSVRFQFKSVVDLGRTQTYRASSTVADGVTSRGRRDSDGETEKSKSEIGELSAVVLGLVNVLSYWKFSQVKGDRGPQSRKVTHVKLLVMIVWTPLATNSLYQAQAGWLGNIGAEHAMKLEVVKFVEFPNTKSLQLSKMRRPLNGILSGRPNHFSLCVGTWH